MSICKLGSSLAIAGFLALAAAPSVASAAVTYHFAETSGVGNLSSGVFGDGVHTPRINNPFTFDFTLANALAASTSYTFGGPGVNVGASGNVLDFDYSDGTPLSSFDLADFPAVHAGFRGGPAAADDVRIGLQTDAAGAISTYSIIIDGRSTVNPNEVLLLQLQKSTPTSGVGVTLAAYDYTGGSYRFTAGDVRCVVQCTGAWTVQQGGGGAGGVPEPASWALMIAGFGGIGGVLRRRRTVVRAAG